MADGSGAMTAIGRGHRDVLCGVRRMWVGGGEQNVWIGDVPRNMHHMGSDRDGDGLLCRPHLRCSF